MNLQIFPRVVSGIIVHLPYLTRSAVESDKFGARLSAGYRYQDAR